ncbi:multimerin-2 [Hyperolius riggenbachi]|uniref:multimerin-2 n=1 Tax=Hyperolius riggenbachi TaxID=752182 RepID=UPI0035A3942F
MAGKLSVLMCCLGMINLVTATLVKPHIYAAGSSPVASTLEVHGISSFAHGLPGHEDSVEKRDLHHGPKLSKDTVLPESQGTQSAPHPEMSKPKFGKWCSVVRNQVVTYVNLCKTEKYVIRSQQPCPFGTPDCQKTMYRHAQRPIYEIKRKFVTSLEWKCCPGFSGSTCEYADPNAIPIHLEHTLEAEKTQELQENTEVKEITEAVESQESLLEDIQNDIHQAASHLMELQNALNHSTSIVLTDNHNVSDTAARKEIDGNLLREVFLPHVESFLRAHFNPMWNSFNKSLQNLHGMVKNLSENVESNRKKLDIFLENMVPKKDLYELGTKFESKIQENVEKLEQLKHDMDKHFHTQQAVIHYNFTMFKADTDVKLKRILKMQQTQYSYLNTSIGELQRGQEQIQDDLLDLSQNLTLHCAPRVSESTSTTTSQINQTLKEHEENIQELLTETDVAFENISTLEKWIKELRTDFKKNTERVQIQFMEKSLIMEENKDLILRQIMELNYTIANMQESYDELFQDCDCHKINSDILALVEIQRNFSNQFRDILYGIEDVKQKEGSSKISLQNTVEDLSLELQLNRQSLTAQQEQGRNLMLITSQLQSQVKNITNDVRLLKVDNSSIYEHIENLDSSFSSLLEDATRHERILGALLGEEAVELFSVDNPEILHLPIIQMYEMLNNTLDRLDKQQIMTDSIIDRLHFLEIEPEKQDSATESTIFNVEQHSDSFQQGNLVHMEANQEASRGADDLEYSDVGILKRDIKQLSEKVDKLESSITDGHFYSNETIEATLQPLSFSVASIKADLSNLREFYNGHIQLFHKIFGKYEHLVSSNVTLDIARINSVINKKMKKLKVAEKHNKKLDKKESEEQWQSDEISISNQDSTVAFFARFSEGADGFKIIRFSDIVLNHGNVFAPEDGHFTAPYSGIYAFAISVDFGVDIAEGRLIFGGWQTLVIDNSSTPSAENLKQKFAVVELKKNDKVWFQLLRGSIKKNTPGTFLFGYMIFKT